MDFKDFIQDDILVLKNLKFENCKISGIKCIGIEIENCIFNNVIFDNNYNGNTVEIRNSKFYECNFQENYKDLLLILEENVYLKCSFQKVNIYGYDEQSIITDNKFEECKIVDTIIEGEFEIVQNTFVNGEIVNFLCDISQVWLNQMESVKILNTKVRAWINENSFIKVDFLNIELTGINKENKYTHCNFENYFMKEDDY